MPPPGAARLPARRLLALVRPPLPPNTAGPTPSQVDGTIYTGSGYFQLGRGWAGKTFYALTVAKP